MTSFPIPDDLQIAYMCGFLDDAPHMVLKRQLIERIAALEAQLADAKDNLRQMTDCRDDLNRLVSQREAQWKQERDQLRAENERLNKWGEGHHAGFVEQYARANRLEAERDQAKAEIKGLPEKVLDAMGAITNQPITIEQMLDFLRQKHQQRDTVVNEIY